MANMDETAQLGLGLVGSFLAGLAIWWMQGRLSRQEYSTADLVNPNAVLDIAETLPKDEDEFIIAANDLVANSVAYQGFASDLYFLNDRIRCKDCYLPSATRQTGTGNCVSMSSMLASILRTRLPAKRVLMAVGDMSVNGFGGHAWVEVQRNNDWYTLEATAPPQGWQRTEQAAKYYHPKTIFNDKDFVCYDPDLCKISVGNCSCLNHMLPLR